MTNPQQFLSSFSPQLTSLREQAEALLKQIAQAQSSLDAQYRADHDASYYEYPWADAPAHDHDCPEGDALSRLDCIEIHLNAVVTDLMSAEEFC